MVGVENVIDESIIGTPKGLIDAKTVRRLPKEQRWCAGIRGVPSNPVTGVQGNHIPIEVGGSRHAERGEDEHATAQEREKCDTQTTLAAPDPTVRTTQFTVTDGACKEYISRYRKSQQKWLRKLQH